MKNHRMEFASLINCDYATIGPKDSRELIIILHGFNQSGAQVLEQMAPALPKDVWIIAPNGPFPQVRRKGADWEMGFAWYFYNPKDKYYYIDTHIPTKFLLNFLARLQVKQQEISIVGFSQGGYLAPYLAKDLPNTRRVIGIGCEFRSSRIPQEQFPFKIDQIHGELDDIVKLEDARNNFEQMLPKCTGGKFSIVNGAGHEWGDLTALKLKEVFGGKIIH